MIGNNSSVTEKLSPQWTNFPLKQLQGKAKYSPTVLMDHYLIAVVHESKSKEDPESLDKKVFLLAVDLRDNSIQEAQVPDSMFNNEVGYTLTKYKDNQIIKFGGVRCGRPHGDVIQMTIKSFKRIFCFFFPYLITITIALSVKCVEIADNSNDDDDPRLHGATAQIHNDHLYVFGGTNERGDKRSELWSFDLSYFSLIKISSHHK